jgi:hypothetical protein
MLDSLLAYRLDTPAPGTLRVRLRQVPLTAMLVLLCVALMGIPLGFGYEMVTGRDPLDALNGQNAMAQLLGVLALGMVCLAGPAGLWFWPLRETLVLSRSDARGWRITCNVFGLRRRIGEEFPLDGMRGLYLREASREACTHLLPVMVDRDGEPHRLHFESVMLYPGSARADNYLRALADFFESTWPAPVKDADEWTRLLLALKERKWAPPSHRAGASPSLASPGTAAALAASPRRRRAGRHAPQPSAVPLQEAVEAPVFDSPSLSMPARVTVGVVGIFLALLTLNNFVALVTGLFSGRLASSGSRFSSGTHVVRFAREPVWFIVNAGMETFGVLILAMFAYGCAKAVLLSPSLQRDKASERRSASAVDEKPAASRK